MDKRYQTYLLLTTGVTAACTKLGLEILTILGQESHTTENGKLIVNDCAVVAGTSAQFQMLTDAVGPVYYTNSAEPGNWKVLVEIDE